MVLSDRSIRELIEAGRLHVDPFDPSSIQPSSIDLRLENRFRVFATTRHAFIDPRSDQPNLTELVTVAEDQPFVLQPGQFCLGNTFEDALGLNAGLVTGPIIKAGTPLAFYG